MQGARAWAFRSGELERELVFGKQEVPTPPLSALPSSEYKVVRGLGRGDGGGTSTPPTWGSAPELLVLFFSQGRAEAAGRLLSKSYCLYT